MGGWAMTRRVVGGRCCAACQACGRLRHACRHLRHATHPFTPPSLSPRPAAPQWFLEQHGQELGDEPAVQTAAKLAQMMAYQNKNFLQACGRLQWQADSRAKGRAWQAGEEQDSAPPEAQAGAQARGCRGAGHAGPRAAPLGILPPVSLSLHPATSPFIPCLRALPSPSHLPHTLCPHPTLHHPPPHTTPHRPA